MRVASRLFLAVVPAVLGVLLVGALAYWGEYRRHAPAWILWLAGTTAVVSLVVTWRNTRFVARRIEQLAGRIAGLDRPRAPSALVALKEVTYPKGSASRDEIDSVASELDRLASEAVEARREGHRHEALAAARVQEYAALLAEGAGAVKRQLQEVALPLHILLENHFGALNENQEEMLGAARQAVDAAGVELDRLQAITSIDQGALAIRRDLVQPGEVLRSLQPLLRAEAERRGLEVRLEIAPGLPKVQGDRARLQEALALLLRHVVSHAEPAVPIVINAEAAGEGPTRAVRIDLHHGPATMLGPDVTLAQRVVAAHGGSLELSERQTVVALPAVQAR